MGFSVDSYVRGGQNDLGERTVVGGKYTDNYISEFTYHVHYVMDGGCNRAEDNFHDILVMLNLSSIALKSLDRPITPAFCNWANLSNHGMV